MKSVPDVSTPFAKTLDLCLTENPGKKHVSALPIWERSSANWIVPAKLHQRLLPGPGMKINGIDQRALLTSKEKAFVRHIGKRGLNGSDPQTQ